MAGCQLYKPSRASKLAHLGVDSQNPDSGTALLKTIIAAHPEWTRGPLLDRNPPVGNHWFDLWRITDT